jgi:hypothetical protein
MLDLSHIPNSQQDIKIFYAASGSNSWQTWQKPRKCNYVWIMCIGGAGGGGGGTGLGNLLSTGGGSGGVSRALYNAQQLPDTLYVQVGVGGAGGVSGANGSPGTRSWVSLQQATTIIAQNIIQGSGAAVAAGGPSGTGATAAGETAIAVASATFLTLSNFIGTAGSTSPATPVQLPTDITPLTSQITCPGAGGPGIQLTSPPTTNNGASILSSSISPLIPGGALATASGSNGGNGADGITSWKPFYTLGGAGGGSAVSGSGGNGGNGGIGSGGGGAGAGNNNFGYTGGRGGKGGDGLVVIISF